MKKKNIVIISLTALIIIVVIGLLWWYGAQPGKYDEFAQCLEGQGVKFYGAFWCSHCQNQKKMFGSSQKYLPYIECSTADGKNQLQVCLDAQVKAYPTWEFADGSRETGELSLQKLSEKSSCPLP